MSTSTALGPENLPEVMRRRRVLINIAAQLNFDEVDVMVGLARLDLLTLTRPATEQRLQIPAEPED